MRIYRGMAGIRICEQHLEAEAGPTNLLSTLVTISKNRICGCGQWTTTRSTTNPNLNLNTRKTHSEMHGTGNGTGRMGDGRPFRSSVDVS